MNKANTNNRTKSIIVTGMFSALICVLAQIVIPTGAVPFSLSLLAIFLTGALLEPRYAFMATLAYILLGAFGLPVFAGMKGGIGVLFDKTGGYIIAYPIMAFVTSLFYTYSKKAKTLFLAAGMLVSLILCYIIGTVWFSFVTGISFAHSLTLCVYPFVAFDIIKIGIALSLSLLVKKTVYRYAETTN